MVNDQLFYSYQMRLEAQKKATASDDSDEDPIMKMGMSIPGGSKFGGGSAPSISNAGSKAVSAAKSAT